jgi:hypothetical protein
MKKATVMLLTLLALVALALPLAAAGTKGSWTGWITDDKCGAKDAKADRKACIEKCMGEGHKLVFYNNADKKLYSLDKQDDAKANIGYEVKVTGEADGAAIKVESIAPSAPKAGGK